MFINQYISGRLSCRKIMWWILFNLSCLYVHVNDYPNYILLVQTSHLWAPAASLSPLLGCHLINLKCPKVNSCYFWLHSPPLPQNTALPPVFSASVNCTPIQPSVKARNEEVVLYLLSALNPTSNPYSSQSFFLWNVPQNFSLFSSALPSS